MSLPTPTFFFPNQTTIITEERDRERRERNERSIEDLLLPKSIFWIRLSECTMNTDQDRRQPQRPVIGYALNDPAPSHAAVERLPIRQDPAPNLNAHSKIPEAILSGGGNRCAFLASKIRATSYYPKLSQFASITGIQFVSFHFCVRAFFFFFVGGNNMLL